jgi:signal peptidase II
MTTHPEASTGAAPAGVGRGLIWLVSILVVADQALKLAVRSSLDLGESVEIIPGFFDLTRVHNSGAAFGMLNGIDFPYKAAALAVVALVALVVVALYASALPASQRLARLGLACIVGGAGGNLIDRVVSGYVVDFVDIYWNGWHFWAFNVADTAITFGVIFMLLDILGVGQHHASRTD